MFPSYVIVNEITHGLWLWLQGLLPSLQIALNCNFSSCGFTMGTALYSTACGCTNAHFIGGLILRRGLLLFLRRGLLQPFSTDCSWWELELSQPIFLFTLQETHSQTCHEDCRIFPFPFFSWLSPSRLMKLPLFYSGQIFWPWQPQMILTVVSRRCEWEGKRLWKAWEELWKVEKLLIERLGLSFSVSPRHQQVMIPISAQQSVYSPTRVFVWL